MDNGFNVLDKYKSWTHELIRQDYETNSMPYAVLMQQLEHDFNIGTVVRSANAFAAREVFYYGNQKRWDRRGAVGTHHYTSVKHLKSYDDIKALKNKYIFVALENTEEACDMPDFCWPENTLMIFGEESSGVDKSLIDISDYVVRIPQFGTVRSLNAGTASAIAMYDYITKTSKRGS